MSDRLVNGTPYSIQQESTRLLEQGILQNKLHTTFPEDLRSYGGFVSFSGSATPSIPINWKFAESLSSLKGLEACFINCLLARKYKEKPAKVEINTDHASLFMMSTILLDLVDKSGTSIDTGMPAFMRMAGLFPSQDPHRSLSSTYRGAATNIYQTGDGRYYHVHGSLNPDPTLTALNLPLDQDTLDYGDSVAAIQQKVAAYQSAELDRLMNDQYKQAGTICWTKEEYAKSEHGIANANVGLFDLKHFANASQPGGWWPDAPNTSSKRPLAGLKVVDLTRIIAGPTITRGLAELGASVMRVTAPHIADSVPLHADLNWGKWNCQLDLRNKEDKEKLNKLILEADVFVDGYRPGVMAKYGFGMEDVIKLCSTRTRGIIYLRENCYGWNGPWAGRSGWQQISDACCGVAVEFGRAMGNDEAVTPIFPNADYCTGIAGVCAVINALINQSEQGGSWGVDVSLNYYSQWLVRSCGVYPPSVWEDLRALHGNPVFRSHHSMLYTLPRMIKLLHSNVASTLFKPEFFEVREAKNIDKIFKAVKPILQFVNGEVDLRYNVGTRTNGADKPYWPKDLMVESVA